MEISPEELSLLTPLALVALAARCGRRVEPLYEPKEGAIDIKPGIDEALTMAEQFADCRCGSADLDFIPKALQVLRIAAISSHAPICVGTVEAALRAVEAARRRDVDAVTKAAWDACDYSVGAVNFHNRGMASDDESAAEKAAVSDYKALLDFKPSQHIDPSPRGPLGPYWPDGGPDWFWAEEE